MSDPMSVVGSVKTLRVLIVEDNDTDFLLTQRQLKKLLSIETLARASCRAELTAALLSPLDLIVTDYHLPDIEGRDLLAAIAAAQAQTPCLVLSGSMPESERAGMPATIVAMLEKGDFEGFSAALKSIRA